MCMLTSYVHKNSQSYMLNWCELSPGQTHLQGQEHLAHQTDPALAAAFQMGSACAGAALLDSMTAEVQMVYLAAHTCVCRTSCSLLLACIFQSIGITVSAPCKTSKNRNSKQSGSRSCINLNTLMIAASSRLICPACAAAFLTNKADACPSSLILAVYVGDAGSGTTCSSTYVS